MYVLESIDRFGRARYYVNSPRWGLDLEMTRDISQATRYSFDEAIKKRNLLFDNGTYFQIKKVETRP